MCDKKVHESILYENLCSFFRFIFVTGLDSDESCEGTSEASFKDAVVDAGAEKNNGTVQENGIKKRR